MFVPIILGSDKTTVSVATGATEYYPLYLSPGNLRNNVRRSHCGGLVVIGFLAIAKSECTYIELIVDVKLIHIFYQRIRPIATQLNFDVSNASYSIPHSPRSSHLFALG
jgi:hypothetical protein